MVFGLFSKEKALKRAQKKALNKLAQSPDRWAAMEKLAEAGDEESLYTLCRRFSFTSLKGVEDEQEKAWVVQTLTSKGEAALPALRRFMKSELQVAFPLRVLADVANRERTLEIIDELLAGEPPGYSRDPQKKIDYIDWLSEYEHASNQEVVARVAPYLADHDENVKFAAAEAIGQRPHADAAEPLVKALIDEDEESKRLRLRIAEVLAENELDLCGEKKAVQALLDDVLSGYKLHRDKLVPKS